jgi:hypothetical protein
MSKRAGNPPVPGHFKVQGGAVEDRDSARMSKQSLAKEAARRKRRAGRKTKLGQAPKEQRAREPKAPESPVLATAKQREAEHARDYQRMNERERRAARRVKPVVEPRGSDPELSGDDAETPLSDLARGMLRRLTRFALAPLTLARAVVDRLRNRE